MPRVILKTSRGIFFIFMTLDSSINFTLQILTLSVSSHVTEGLCKIAGFECLRHGTTPGHYWSIVKNGADPEIAKAIGTHQGESKFFLLRDSDKVTCFDKLRWPRVYAAGQAFCSTPKALRAFTNNTSVIAPATLIYTFLNFVCPPTVRFVYRKSEIEEGDIFQRDGVAETAKRLNPLIGQSELDYYERLGGIAVETIQRLPTNRIGLVGICAQIKLEDVSGALKRDPLRVITGVAELAIGLAITYYGYGLVL